MTKLLPPDPEGMNDKRAEWANACLYLLTQLTGCDMEEASGDLIVNILHWRDRNIDTSIRSHDNFLDAQLHCYNEETEAPGTIYNPDPITHADEAHDEGHATPAASQSGEGA